MKRKKTKAKAMRPLRAWATVSVDGDAVELWRTRDAALMSAFRDYRVVRVLVTEIKKARKP